MKTTFPASICLILLLGAAQPAWSAAAKTADRLLGELRLLVQESREKRAADPWLVLHQSAGALTLRSLQIEGT